MTPAQTSRWLTANRRPKPVVPEVELDGFTFMTIPRPSQLLQPRSMLLLVDSGSLDHYVEDTIIPELETLTLNVEQLKIPRKISMAGNHILLGRKAGILPGTVVDKDGRHHSVQIAGVNVSSMGRHRFSSKKSDSKGSVYDNRLRPAAPTAK